MSERTTQVRPDFDPDHNNDADNGEVSTYDPNKAKKFRRRLIIGASATAAGITAAAVFGLGMNNHSNGEAPQARPTAAAGATPGEKVSTPATAETGVDKMTLQNFDYVVDGQHYVGEDALKDGFGISAEQYSSSDGKAIAEAFFEKLQIWQNLPATAEQKKVFANYTSADGHGGIGAMNVDFVNPGVINALTGSLPEGSATDGVRPPADWMQEEAKLVNETGGNRTIAEQNKKPGDEPYESRQVVDKNHITVPAYNDDLISVIVPVTYVDNGTQNAIGRFRSAPGGYNGVTMPSVAYDNTYSLAFSRNTTTNTWDLVSAITVQ